MKKVLAVVVIILLLLIAFSAGYGAGKQHIITDQELWIVDYEHDPSCDVEIHSYVDGEWNIYNGFIG